MPKIHVLFCNLCGIDFKSLSPFAKTCPKCKVVRFKKPEPLHKDDMIRSIISPAKLVDLAIARR